MVEVEHDRRALRPVALDVGDVALELALERAAVEQAGERVVVGHVAQLGLVAAALGDVLHLREEVQRPLPSASRTSVEVIATHTALPDACR